MPKVIAVCGRKGGVGKTTIALGLASVWHKRGHSVVLADLDPQSNASYGLGGDCVSPSTADLMLHQTSPELISERLGLYNGGPSLETPEVAELHPEDLADVIRQLPCDYVICDCPPLLKHLERMGITASDVALVVLDAHPFAMKGAGEVFDVLGHIEERGRRGPSRKTLVFSKIDYRQTKDRKATSIAEEHMPDISHFTIRKDEQLATATSEQKLIADVVRQDSRGLADLNTLADWIDHE